MVQYVEPTKFALDIVERQYLHKDPEGNLLEDHKGMLLRVAYHVACAEAIDAYKKDHGEYPEWYQTFEGRREYLTDPEKLHAWIVEEGYKTQVDAWYDVFKEVLLARRAIGAGRVLAGAGSRYGQMMNCFVLASEGNYIDAAKGDPDSIDGIYELAYQLAKVTQKGGGCGVYLGNLREAQSFVKGSGGKASGVVSWLRLLYATTLRLIKLEGVRRGAGMATLNIDHPDALDFLTAKDLDREALEGKIESFNISFLITDEFMALVETEDYHTFRSAVDGSPTIPNSVPGKYHYPGETPTSLTGNPSDSPTSVEIPLVYRARESGEIYEVENFHDFNDSALRPEGEFVVSAAWLWNEIATHAWATGDPGVLYVDQLNRYWPMKDHLGPIVATNPCGEEGLAPSESCCLSQMILSSYIEGDLYDNTTATFNTDLFYEDVKTMVRFLDNVLTMNVHPLPTTMRMCDSLRRIGLGVIGDADMCIKAGVGYDSRGGQSMRKSVADLMRLASIEASEELANEKGTFPMYDEATAAGHTMPFSPRRNVHILSIAPTGTTSMVADASSGIEPIFALNMSRKVGNTYMPRLHPLFENYITQKRPDIDLSDKSVMLSVAANIDAAGKPVYKEIPTHPLIVAIMENHGSIRGLTKWFSKDEQMLFSVAHDIIPEKHVEVQAAWQSVLDRGDLREDDDNKMPMASISKTINAPSSFTVEEVKDIYYRGWIKGLKGITIYRNGSRIDQVLRTDSEEKKEKEEDKPEEKPEVWEQPSSLHTPTRGVTTKGFNYKAEFRASSGKARKVYLYVGENENGYPVEIFVADKRAGAEVDSYATALSIMVSIALKYGTPVEVIIDKLKGLQGDSISYTGGMFQSVPDLIAKRLAETVYNSGTEADYVPPTNGANGSTPTINRTAGALNSMAVSITEVKSGESCDACDTGILVYNGRCPTCTNCGRSKCS